MAKRISASQIRSKIRQAQSKQKQAINKFNQEVRKHNAAVKRVHQDRKVAIQKLNRLIREHNSRVKIAESRRKTASARLKNSVNSQRISASQNLNERMILVQSGVQPSNPFHAEIVSLAGNEAANSLELAEAGIRGDDIDGEDADLQESEIDMTLKSFSTDLHGRWVGALFALNPKNPDAARHFSTSCREILAEILRISAPNKKVLPECSPQGLDQNGKPTRRSRIEYMLSQREVADDALTEFVDADITDVLNVIKETNSATHGEAGKFSFAFLAALKLRIEDAISFLLNIAEQNK